MKALVVFTYIDCTDDCKTKVSNVVLKFKGGLATQEEIENIEKSLERYPCLVSPRIVNIVKLEG